LSGVIRQDAEEKYSYVVIQKTPRHRSNGSTYSSDWLIPREKSLKAATSGIPTPLEVLKRVMACRKDSDVMGLVDELLDEVDWDEYTPPLHRNEWSRIIRSPIKGNGHITMDVCASSGQVVRHVLSKSNVAAIPPIFVALRKTTWGGLIPFLEDRIQISPFSVEGANRQSTNSAHAIPTERGDFQVPFKSYGEFPVKESSSQSKGFNGMKSIQEMSQQLIDETNFPSIGRDNDRASKSAMRAVAKRSPPASFSTHRVEKESQEEDKSLYKEPRVAGRKRNGISRIKSLSSSVNK
jgi:ribosomal protein RSM22 (predicted rRNA methylase)